MSTDAEMLIWGVKSSLIDYVRRMPDGRVEVSDGAEAAANEFRFVASGSLRFRGAVTLTGHSGMLRLRIADPSIIECDRGWAIEIADPDDPSVRVRFATMTAFDGVRGSGTALTADAADLFFGPYRAGTPADDPRVER